MSIYSFHMSNVSRSKGSNSCASVSYITGQSIHCDRNGETYHYSHAERVAYADTFLPDSAPAEWHDPTILWNEVESSEKADNARVAKKFIAALPNELSLDQDIAIVKKFSENLTTLGYPVTAAIHNNEGNIHTHILCTNRPVDKNGKWSSKCRKEYALDDNGDRIPIIDPETGEQKIGKNNRKMWKRITVESNPLDQKETLNMLREQWEICCNEYLDDEHKIDRRSYEERNINKIPEIHEGYAARQIEARGGKSERCEYNRQVRKQNSILDKMQSEIESLSAAAAELLKEIVSVVTKPFKKDEQKPMTMHDLLKEKQKEADEVNRKNQEAKRQKQHPDHDSR